jgi:predicted helicase
VPECRRLSFKNAVERGLLTDYEVLVRTVADDDVIAGPLQQQITNSNPRSTSTTPARSYLERRQELR